MVRAVRLLNTGSCGAVYSRFRLRRCIFVTFPDGKQVECGDAECAGCGGRGGQGALLKSKDLACAKRQDDDVER